MSATGTVPAPRRWTFRRVRFPTIAVGITALLAVVVWLLPTDRLDVGMRRTVLAVVIALCAAVILLWFLLFSVAAARTRLATFMVLLAALGGLAASVRRLEFTGDMTPLIDWRWQPERNATLEAHRASRDRPAMPNNGAPISVGPNDVLEYRGASRDGRVHGPALARSWSERLPQLVWRQPVGGGYAAFVAAGPVAVTIEQRRDREAVVAYDIDTGNERWVHEYAALFHEKLGGDGPRATPTIHGERVVALGATGILSCLDLATGQLQWSKNILDENRCGNLDWAMAGSPLVFDDLIVVNSGTQKGDADSYAIMGLRLENGQVMHRGGRAKAGYASPMLVELAGRRQILIFDGDGLAGYDAANFDELWRTPWKSDFDINAAQPIVLSRDRVLISSSAGSALLQFTERDGAFSVTEKWKNRNMKCNYACPIAHGDFVYGLDSGILVCLETDGGKRRWKGGRYGHGQMLLAGDLLVVLAEMGELALVEATPDHFKELGRIQAIEGRTWNNPTLKGSRLLLRNHLEMAAYDLPLLDPHQR